MANRIQTGSESSLADTVSGIVHDIQELVKHQLALFRTEIREDFRKTRESAVSLIVGLALATVGGLLLAHMLVHLLAWAFPGLAQWACYGIVSLVLLTAGGAFIYLGKSRLDSFNPLPDESVEAMKENVQWIMKPKAPT